MTSAEASYWAAAWGGQLFFDAVVFILTLKKLTSSHSLGRRTFMSLLLRDGVMYFAMWQDNDCCKRREHYYIFRDGRSIQQIDVIRSDEHVSVTHCSRYLQYVACT